MQILWMASQVRFLCLGSKRPSGLGGWAIQLLDGRRHPMRLRKESGIWELFTLGRITVSSINTR